MKKATIIFTVALTLAYALMVGYVAFSPDFVDPGKEGQQADDAQGNGDGELAEDNPIWGKSMDDLVAYLEENGLAKKGEFTPLTAGVATVAQNYDGMELYWWDVENLEEGTDEYNAYVSACKDGTIDLWGSGMIMNVTVHGPFAINGKGYMGDTDAYTEIFMKYCMEEKGKGTELAKDNPIWGKNMDDLVAYLEEHGLAKKGEFTLLARGVATVAQMYDGMELYWWDVENLEEGTNEYNAYVSACENGTVDLYGSGNIMYVTVHGPFAINSLLYMGDTDAYREIFLKYCME